MSRLRSAASRFARDLLAACLIALPAGRLAAGLADVRRVADEVITTTTPSSNGSNPMWCAGAPLVVRDGGTVWASISVHDPEAPPMCNTHWELWRRTDSGSWTKVRLGPAATEREPCPLFMTAPDNLLLSIHPKIAEHEPQANGDFSWFAQPAVIKFDPRRISKETDLLQPEFFGRPQFNQHSYRSVAVDSRSDAFVTMIIDREDNFNVTWRDASGVWHPVKEPAFPIRSCYADMLLAGREGHVFAIGDIKEPVHEWKEEKFRVLNREWDYAFRRLFYAHSPDLGSGEFNTPTEIDSVDNTAGWAYNLDMAFDSAGRVHLLWVRQNIQYDFMRDRFFPGTPIIEEVRHAVIDKDRVVSVETLSRRKVDGSIHRRSSTAGRFHTLPDGRLVAILIPGIATAGETRSSELLLQELDPDSKSSAASFRVALDQPAPAGMFFTNTPRGGSKPDRNIDILATDTKDGVISLRYIHVLIP